MRLLRALGATVALTLFSAAAFAQTQPGPTPAHTSPHQQPKGFFDYALGKINHDGNDYGSALAQTRHDVVQSTVDDLFFWSNVFTLTMLTGISGTLYLTWQASRKKELIAIAVITQLYNGRLSDRAELNQRTAQYNTLAERYNSDIEQTLLTHARKQTSEETASSRIKRNAERLGRNSGSPPNPAEAVSHPATSPSETPQNTLLLEHRLEAMRNTEVNLRERLNQTTLQLEQERTKNARLKGI